MTEHKTMNTIIHAAIRRDLKRFEEALVAFPAGSRGRAGQLKAAWDHFAYQLHRHHEDEETFFWPALRDLGADNTLVGDLHGEHAVLLRALESGNVAMADLDEDPSAENAESARAVVSGLEGIVEDHLVHEERDLEPFTAGHHGAPQLKEAARSARRAHAEGGGVFFSWLRDGIDADAARALRGEVPAPVLFMLTRLGRRRYERRIASAWS